MNDNTLGKMQKHREALFSPVPEKKVFSSLTAFVPSLLATKLSVFGNDGIGLEKQGIFSLLLIEENGSSAAQKAAS